ncbi:MAG TPA: SpoIIE family protein phosphatase, partial [Leptospiraceae bacterium]|nr:SpoIIE family protein phosphatase [Leptospiraceae bacterium]
GKKEELENLLHQYKDAIDQSTILSKTDKYGKITYANDEFCKLSKYSREELVGKPHNIVRHPESPKSLFADLWRTIKKGKTWKGIIMNRAKDGERYVTQATIIPIIDINGQIEEFISIRTDITELFTIKSQLQLLVEQKTEEISKTFGKLKEDLLIAKKMQRSLLPSNLQTCKDLTIVAEYLPLNQVGGDIYCFDEISNSKYRIFIADASGHGVQAALVTMAIKGIYDNLKRLETNLSDILKIFNTQYIRLYGSLKTFFTCILIEIDCPNQKLTYASGGHHSSVLLNGKNITLLPKTGSLLGVKDNAEYTQIERTFQKDDRLFLFTDGIFEEFRNLDMFGEEKLHDIFVNNSDLPISDILQKSLSELSQFIGKSEPQDDITILGIHF